MPCGPFFPWELELGVGPNGGQVNGAGTCKMGELGKDGLEVGEGGRQIGANRRSSFDILICCSTTVSFSSTRSAYQPTRVNTAFSPRSNRRYVPQDPRPYPEDRPFLQGNHPQVCCNRP